MNWYLKCLKQYADFSGRARRKEFWMFVLFNVIFGIVAAIIDHLLGTTFKMNTLYGQEPMPYGWVYLIYGLAVLIPGLAVTVRRLYDIGKSGGWIFIALIPFVGAIWLLVLYCQDSVDDNEYGANPKA